MKQGKFQIALVGCGGMAALYRHRYTEIPGAELALLIDASPETAQNASAALGGIPWSTAFADCLAADIDMVDISTPNFLHAQQGIAALKAGKHVLLQKPLAPSVAEGEAIVEAAGQSAGKAGMFMSMLDIPLVHALMTMIAEGCLGRVSSVHCRNAHRGGLYMQPGTWRGDLEKCGGGAFIQLGIHMIHLAQWLLSDRIVSVSGYAQNRFCPGIGGEDVCMAACAFESGALGSLEASYCADRSDLAIYGDHGYFVLNVNQSLELCLDAPFSHALIHYETPGKRLLLPLSDYHQDYHRPNLWDQHQAFVQAVMRGQEPPVPVADGLRDLRITQAIYGAAQSGKRTETGI